MSGSTGAGKSTAAGLLLRFYDPQAGRVMVDGRDVREFTLDSMREQISLVLQDSLLFSGSVCENIAFGKPDATDAEALAAATAANAHEFIRRMPDGYSSNVSERAVMEAIQRVARGRTAIIIAHRLATVRFADRIVVVDRGHIVEQGTHTMPLEQSGACARLNRI